MSGNGVVFGEHDLNLGQWKIIVQQDWTYIKHILRLQSHLWFLYICRSLDVLCLKRLTQLENFEVMHDSREDSLEGLGFLGVFGSINMRLRVYSPYLNIHLPKWFLNGKSNIQPNIQGLYPTLMLLSYLRRVDISSLKLSSQKHLGKCWDSTIHTLRIQNPP